MRDKPDFNNEQMIACLRKDYGLDVRKLIFLPIGADRGTAVYRAVTRNGEVYFVKLRRSEFLAYSVAVPKYLSDLGLRQVIPPLATREGCLSSNFESFTLILYPFVEGVNGFQKNLSDEQWVEFGAAMKQFHSAEYPPPITNGVPLERFSTSWRDSVLMFLERVNRDVYHESVAKEAAAFLISKSEAVVELVDQSSWLALQAQVRNDPYILCHGDIHGWNLLLTDSGALYMVDWDTLIFAPKERDLMFIGAGLEGHGRSPQEEEALFYQGYGGTQIDRIAINYYRCERIIEDIAVFCEQIFLSEAGGEDRDQALIHLKSNFLPGGAIEMANQGGKRF